MKLVRMIQFDVDEVNYFREMKDYFQSLKDEIKTFGIPGNEYVKQEDSIDIILDELKYLID